MRYKITIDCDEEEFSQVSAMLCNKEVPYKKKYPKDVKLKNPNAPATEKQKNYLLEADYLGDVESLTQIEASKLIEEHIKQKGQ